jgi:predicted phage-related endonuclease
MTQLIGGDKFSADVTQGRDQGIGGSDAGFIMRGEWRQLYRQKLGLDPTPDFDAMFNVQLGKYTEPFHLEWLAKTGVIHQQIPDAFYVHPDHGFLFAHLDGWDARADTFVEMKHLHGAADYRERAVYYMPQLAHECLVTGKAQCWFSVIAGNQEPVCQIVQPSADYLEQYFELAKQFWWHVAERVEPEADLSWQTMGAIAEANADASAAIIDGLRDYDMGQSNAWAEQAGQLLANKEAFAAYGKADKAIRELVPKDGAVVRGHGVCFKRDKRGSIRISFE